MTKFDDIISLGEETAEMLFADDEDQQQVVKGEAEIAVRLTAASKSIEASLKDDLLLIQEHKGESQKIVEEIREKRRKLDEMNSVAKEAKSNDENKLEKNYNEIDGLRTEKDELNLHVKKIAEEDNHLRERLRKELAVAKAKLRFYSSVTGIEWDAGNGGAGADSVVGVFTGEKRAAPFQFDKKRKTSFEITNALWDLIDEGAEDETDDCWK